ncbi:P22 coat-protein 5 family protein (plasmid) [Rhodovastum atsumiense]|uniref:P22 coat-protein 5 family protein n=1 Tax=Rhodovastum atsumiense TaxID=504468 RepID=A0A5M6IN27_9PROT|nr:P22 phage major capsid protein family protein [Rhodovastum atsumiense]KAA5609663.1 P22 coat - protein 5 family protein [Rhodovastum atsumiense]CAH2606424.1 P22 coat-protein 5 family protein [Rhodovastum atsumiense]
MANTLTNLIPTIYEAIDIVSREMVGFIPAVTRNASAERAALNQTILVPITQAQTAADNTPAVTPPNTGDQTVGNVAMTISRSKHVPIRWNGEERVGLQSAGTYQTIIGQQFQQAFRTLVNMIEADLWAAAYQGASRAYGTAGTTPFGTSGDLSDIAQVRRILDDNGAPQTDLQLVLGSAAVANLRGRQSLLLKVNEAGSAGLLRRGSISEMPLEGFELHNSYAIQTVTKGTGASYVTSGATAPGVSSVALVTGSGTVLAGDIVTFAADTANKYVVNSGVAAPGTITLGAPGAMVTIPTGNALTVGGNYTPNVAFSRSAIQLIARMPARPEGGDMAEDVMTVTDPVSGLSFEISEYKQFRQTAYHVAIAWGVANTKPAHTAILIG